MTTGQLRSTNDRESSLTRARPPGRLTPERVLLAGILVFCSYTLIIAAAALAQAIELGVSMRWVWRHAIHEVTDEWRFVVIRNSLAEFLLPERPVLTATLSLVLAQCNLAAIWLARSRLPSYAKVLIAALECCLFWGLLIGLLPETELRSPAAAGWAACIFVQSALTGVFTTVIDGATHGRIERPQKQFSLLFLFLWTAVVAVLCGGGRQIAEALGWTIAVLQWQFFQALAAVGMFNATWSLAILIALAMPISWRWRLVALVAVFAGSALATPLAMLLLLANAGASYWDMVWLFGTQSLFITSTLLPFQLARYSLPFSLSLAVDKSSE